MGKSDEQRLKEISARISKRKALDDAKKLVVSAKENLKKLRSKS